MKFALHMNAIWTSIRSCSQKLPQPNVGILIHSELYEDFLKYGFIREVIETVDQAELFSIAFVLWPKQVSVLNLIEISQGLRHAVD